MNARIALVCLLLCSGCQAQYSAEVVYQVDTGLTDHAVLRVATTFEHWARVGLPPALGEEVYFQGSPRGLAQLLRVGRMAGKGHLPKSAQEDSPVLAREFTLYDVQVAPGDSGSGIFNRNGELVGVVSIMTWDATLPANFMGSLPFAFTAKQWQDAGK